MEITFKVLLGWFLLSLVVFLLYVDRVPRRTTKADKWLCGNAIAAMLSFSFFLFYLIITRGN